MRKVSKERSGTLALESVLEGGNRCFLAVEDVNMQLSKTACYLMVCNFFPELVEFSALGTHELATITTVACCCGFFAFFALRLLWFFHLCQCSMNLKQVIDVEGCLQSWDPSGGSKVVRRQLGQHSVCPSRSLTTKRLRHFLQNIWKQGSNFGLV